MLLRGRFWNNRGYLPKTNHLIVFQSHNLSQNKINYAVHDHSLHIYDVDLKDKFLL